MTFTAYGLHLHSQLPLPGAIAAAEALPDLTITLGPATLAAPYRELGPYQLAGTSLLFTLPNVARYLSHAGRTLIVDPAPAVPLDEVAAFLIATALPAALWQRGDLVLHAAAAVLPGRTHALAFAGPSGCGKSTLLRHLLAQGAAAVADDTLRLHGDLQISGLPAATQLRVSGTDTRTYLPVPAPRQLASAPLAALFVPGPEPHPVRLHGAHALAALLRNLHRPLVPQLLGLTAALLPRLAQLARAIPVYSVHYQAKALDVQRLDSLQAGQRETA